MFFSVKPPIKIPRRKKWKDYKRIQPSYVLFKLFDNPQIKTSARVRSRVGIRCETRNGQPKYVTRPHGPADHNATIRKQSLIILSQN